MNDLNERNNRMFLFSMPPYRKTAGDVLQIHRQAFIQWSEAVLGVALSRRIPCYNTYYDVVNNDGYVATGGALGYQDPSDGVHYQPDGAKFICQAAARAFESNRIGGAGPVVY